MRLDLAIKVAKYLDSNQIQWDRNSERNPTKRLCILSYGLYSELMASTAANLLRQKRNNWIITHAILNDIESGKIDKDIKEYELIIVIPIASTLSTITKILHSLTQNDITPNHNNIPINLIVAGHKKIDDEMG